MYLWQKIILDKENKSAGIQRMIHLGCVEIAKLKNILPKKTAILEFKVM